MQAKIKSNTAAGTFALFSLYNQITCDTTRALGIFLALSEEAYSNSHSLVIADRVSSGEVRVQLTLEKKQLFIPVPMLTTAPRPLFPFRMMMAARIFRPSKLCWMRAVRVLKRWWLSIAI